jgi:hypothetical protein
VLRRIGLLAGIVATVMMTAAATALAASQSATNSGKKHAEAGRSVQESEERIIEGCKTLLDRLS